MRDAYPDCVDPKTKTCRRATFFTKLQTHIHKNVNKQRATLLV